MELLLLVGKEEKSKKIQHPNLFHTTVIQAKQEKPTFKRKTTKKKRKKGVDTQVRIRIVFVPAGQIVQEEATRRIRTWPCRAVFSIFSSR